MIAMSSGGQVPQIVVQIGTMWIGEIYTMTDTIWAKEHLSDMINTKTLTDTMIHGYLHQLMSQYQIGNRGDVA